MEYTAGSLVIDGTNVQIDFSKPPSNKPKAPPTNEATTDWICPMVRRY
jgi:hypothetical protein